MSDRQIAAQASASEYQRRRRALTAADRQRRHRERIREGLRVYTVELNEKATDDLVFDAGHETFGELLEELLELDARIRVTRDRRGLALVLLSLADELSPTGDKAP